MEHFGLVIRRLRESKGLPLREVSSALNIDQAVISKLERRQRAATEGQVHKLAEFYQVPPEALITHWLSDKIALSLKGQEMALEALEQARQKVLSQAREDFSRESVFHQVYHVCRKNNFPRVWVFGPFAEEKNILSRQLSVLIEATNNQRPPETQVQSIQEKLEKATKMKVECFIKDSSGPDPCSEHNKILIWESTLQDQDIIQIKKTIMP